MVNIKNIKSIFNGNILSLICFAVAFPLLMRALTEIKIDDSPRSTWWSGKKLTCIDNQPEMMHQVLKTDWHYS